MRTLPLEAQKEVKMLGAVAESLAKLFTDLSNIESRIYVERTG